MISGIPTALTGQIYHAIDGQPCVEAVDFDLTYDPPMNSDFGFAGKIGTAKGQADCEVMITFAGVSGKAQFNLLALAAERKPGSLGFTYDFWEGDVGISNHWLMTNCQLSGFKLKNDPKQGITRRSCKIIGSVPKLIS